MFLQTSSRSQLRRLLLAVAGFNLSRFMMPIADTRARVRAGLRTVARVAVPTVLWTAALGAVLKYSLAEGVARWQLATGTTLIEGWTDLVQKLRQNLYLPDEGILPSKPVVDEDVDGEIATVTLDRPERLNAMNAPMLSCASPVISGSAL